MAWTLKEHLAEPDRLGRLLYWQEGKPNADDQIDVIYQNDSSLMSVLRYRGPDMESADAYELLSLNTRYHAIELSLGAGWTMHSEERRHQAAAYPTRQWTHPVPALLDEERRAQVEEPGTHFETTYHLALTKQIPRHDRSWFKRIWWENIPTGHAQVNAETAFREEVARVQQELGGLFEEVELLTDDALATYLHSCISSVMQPYVAMPDPPYMLHSQLADVGFYSGVVPKLGDVYLRPVIIKNKKRQPGFPKSTYPGIMDVLHDLPVEYRYSRRWIPLDYATAHKELNHLEDRFHGQHKSFWTQLAERFSGHPSAKVEQAADKDAAEMSEARASLDDGDVAWGYPSMVVVVWDKDFAVAEQKKDLVVQTWRSKGFLAEVEAIDAVGAWLGTLPGDSYHNVERPLMHSLNATHFAPTTSVWSGPTWVPHLHGGPLVIATGRGNTPFRVTTHYGDVGDFSIISPKGSGKSAWLAHMASMWWQYDNPSVFALDKGGSMKALCLAMDGLWVDLAPMTARPLQPLARIDDPEERAWGVGLLEDILTLEGLARTPTLNALLWNAMQALVPFPVHHRTLSGYCGLIQESQVRDALSKYTVDGQYPILDGDRDWLQMARFTVFEMEKLIDDYPRLVYPVAKVIFRRIEQALTGSPTLMTIDECHAYFALEVLAQRLLSWLKTLRRRNVAMGFASQNLLDLLKSPVGQEVIQACPTRFWGANSHALEPEVMKLYTGLGLTRRHCELIANLVPKRDLFYQGAEGNRVFRNDMGRATVSFCGRSNVKDLARLSRVFNDPTRTEPFSVAWLRDEGHDDLANLLGEEYAHYDNHPTHHDPAPEYLTAVGD